MMEIFWRKSEKRRLYRK